VIGGQDHTTASSSKIVEVTGFKVDVHITMAMWCGHDMVFTRESNFCFQRVLAIAILPVRPSVCHTGGSVKTVQARITKSSPSAARKTLVSGTVKLFHKFEGGNPKRER